MHLTYCYSGSTSAKRNCEKPYRARSSPSKVINLGVDHFVIEYEEHATMPINIAFFLVELLFSSFLRDQPDYKDRAEDQRFPSNSGNFSSSDWENFSRPISNEKKKKRRRRRNLKKTRVVYAFSKLNYDSLVARRKKIRKKKIPLLLEKK